MRDGGAFFSGAARSCFQIHGGPLRKKSAEPFPALVQAEFPILQVTAQTTGLRTGQPDSGLGGVRTTDSGHKLPKPVGQNLRRFGERSPKPRIQTEYTTTMDKPLSSMLNHCQAQTVILLLNVDYVFILGASLL